MAWLTCNGIELARAVSLPSPPSSEHRDIGHVGEAADGTTVVTRLSRKRDLKLTTKPLSAVAAVAWEGLLAGESHVWSFDASKYSSKGLAPTMNAGTLENTGPSPVFGAKYLRIESGDVLTYAGLYEVDWTVSAWLQDVGGPITSWTHYVATSVGRKWANGIRNDSFVSDGVFSFTDGTLTVSPFPYDMNIDDLVVSPFLWPDDWAAQVFRAGVAFGPAPFLSMAGDMAREASTRRMICKSVTEKFMVANPGGGLQRDVRALEFALAEV